MQIREWVTAVRGFRVTIEKMQKYVAKRDDHADRYEEIRDLTANAKVFFVGDDINIRCANRRDRARLVKLLGR